MIQAQMVSGELPIHREPNHHAPRVGSLGADPDEVVFVRSTRPDLWMRIERLKGRPGWIDGADSRLQLRCAVRVKQSKVSVIARPGDRAEPLRVLKRRAKLTLLRSVDEAGQRWVHVRLPSGKEGFVAGGTRVVDDEHVDELAGDAHAFAFEEWFLRRGVAGGVALIVIAAVWFFVGLDRGWVFYYPPALALFGVAGIVLGLRMGNMGALETAARLAPPER